MPQVVNLRNLPLNEALWPEGITRIDRKTKWGNPFHIGRDGTREDIIRKHREWFLQLPEASIRTQLDELRGKDLACWCSPLQCHGDTLLELANAPPKE